MRVRACRFIISALSRDDDDDAFARPRAAVKDAMNATFFFNVLDNKLLSGALTLDSLDWFN